MDRMRSSASAARRGCERRGEYGNVVDVSVGAAAGWPLGRHGKDVAMEGGVSVMASEASRLDVMLGQEVEELIERQPQFGFLKPCRQLEKHYANKKEAIPRDCSGVHHSQTVAEAMAFEDTKEVQNNEGQKLASGTMREFLSCNGIELNGLNVEGKSDAQGASRGARSVATTREHREVGRGRGHFHRNSGEKIWRISSTRYSIHEKETHVDPVNPAATKFLTEMSPGAHASPPAVAVPFKWEDAPGRAKEHAAAAANPTLQLPPRLAAPRSDAAFSRQLQVSVISHPLAGLFPCIGANSPSPSPPLQHQQRPHPQQPQQLQPQLQQQQLQQQQQQQQQEDHITWMHYRASKSYGGVYQNVRKQNKSFSQPLASTNQSMGAKPRRTFSSELGSSGGASSTDPTSSTRSSSSSILHGSQQSSSSSRTYLSCELDASTPRTADSKSSSSASYESIGEDFDPDVDSSTSPRPPLAVQSTRHRRPEPKGLLKLCKSHGNCLRKSKSRRRVCSPEVWAPTLATYFQRMDLNDPPLLDKPVASAAAPTSSGYLNSKGEPVPLHSAPDAAPASSRCVSSEGEPKPAGDGGTSSPEISPKRPTRLPYKMPSVAEQEQGRSMGRHRSALSVELQCASPVYAAALEMLSPAAVTLMASSRHQRAASRALPSPKPHRRVQFILSMCKTLKRVFFRQQPRRSVVGTRLMYHDHRAPTTFQFSKPN